MTLNMGESNSIHSCHHFFSVNYLLPLTCNGAKLRSISIQALSNRRMHLDKLLERAVEGRAERLDVLVEVNGSLSTLGNAFWGELEFL